MITGDQAPSSGEFADSSSCCGQPEFPNVPADHVADAAGAAAPSGRCCSRPTSRAARTSQEPYNHFSLLRTIEDLFGLEPHRLRRAAAGQAASAVDCSSPRAERRSPASSPVRSTAVRRCARRAPSTRSSAIMWRGCVKVGRVQVEAQRAQRQPGAARAGAGGEQPAERPGAARLQAGASGAARAGRAPGRRERAAARPTSGSARDSAAQVGGVGVGRARRSRRARSPRASARASRRGRRGASPRRRGRRTRRRCALRACEHAQLGHPRAQPECWKPCWAIESPAAGARRASRPSPAPARRRDEGRAPESRAASRGRLRGRRASRGSARSARTSRARCRARRLRSCPARWDAGARRRPGPAPSSSAAAVPRTSRRPSEEPRSSRSSGRTATPAAGSRARRARRRCARR